MKVVGETPITGVEGTTSKDVHVTKNKIPVNTKSIELAADVKPRVVMEHE